MISVLAAIAIQDKSAPAPALTTSVEVRENSLVGPLNGPLHKLALQIVSVRAEGVELRGEKETHRFVVRSLSSPSPIEGTNVKCTDLHLLVIRRQVLPSRRLHELERRAQGGRDGVRVERESADGLQRREGLGEVLCDVGDEQGVDAVRVSFEEGGEEVGDGIGLAGAVGGWVWGRKEEELARGASETKGGGKN